MSSGTATSGMLFARFLREWCSVPDSCVLAAVVAVRSVQPPSVLHLPEAMQEVSLAPRRSLSPMDAPDRARHSRRSLTPGDSRGARSRSASPYGDLSSKVALFNKHASDHQQGQAVNPFSGDGRVSPRPRLDKTDASYGKPVGKTALRGMKAQSQVSKEILELCEVISENGESLSDGPEDNDPRVAISFGHLFHIYTYISNKVVGILLRARKQKLVDFEGETLFQKRDDHVPVIMLKPIQEIRQIFRTAEQKERELRKQQEQEVYLQEHPEVLIEEELRKAYEEELAAQEEEERRMNGVPDQPKPTIEFQLQVQDVAEDGPAEATTTTSGDAKPPQQDASSETQQQIPEKQNGYMEEKPLEASAQEISSSAEQAELDATATENKPKCEPDIATETGHEKDLEKIALANPEELKAQEKIC